MASQRTRKRLRTATTKEEIKSVTIVALPVPVGDLDPPRVANCAILRALVPDLPRDLALSRSDVERILDNPKLLELAVDAGRRRHESRSQSRSAPSYIA